MASAQSAAAARLAMFDRLIGTRGRTEAQRRVYGDDASGQLYRDRAAVAARPARTLPPASRALPARAMPPRATALKTVNDRADRREDRLALDRLIAKIPTLVQYGNAPPGAPPAATIANASPGHRQYHTIVSNPAATAAAIVAAGERGRLGLGSSRRAPQLTGRAARIIAAGKQRRGEI